MLTACLPPFAIIYMFMYTIISCLVKLLENCFLCKEFSVSRNASFNESLYRPHSEIRLVPLWCEFRVGIHD